MDVADHFVIITIIIINLSSQVRILEAFMDFSPTSAGLFRDLGGLAAMIQRLQGEVGLAGGKLKDAADKGKQKVGEARPEYAVSYARRLLLKSLLRAIALASYAPGSAARPQVSFAVPLPVRVRVCARERACVCVCPCVCCGGERGGGGLRVKAHDTAGLFACAHAMCLIFIHQRHQWPLPYLCLAISITAARRCHALPCSNVLQLCPSCTYVCFRMVLTPVHAGQESL